MKKTLWIIMTVALLGMVSCGKSRDQRIQEIKDYEKSLNLESTAINEETGNALIDYYTRFVKDFPEDTLAPAYLFRAAEVAMNTGKTEQSIHLLDEVISKYPAFYDVPTAYFMKGYVYENSGNDKDKAVEAYSIFLEKYPEHELAKDAQILIEVIDLTPEELIERLIMQQGIEE